MNIKPRTKRSSPRKPRTRASSTMRPPEIRATVAQVCTALEAIAPAGLAQSWDRVGLLAGDPKAGVRRIVACIDLTTAVAAEAASAQAELIVVYHPPIFEPISSLRADSSGMESLVFQCVRGGIALYAMHTALDAADGGTNDVLADLCGIRDREPLEYVDEPKRDELKLAVFVPPNHVEQVAQAMFNVGAGHIGHYRCCSFRAPGQGTFFGGETTTPAVGERGRLEHVEELRLETIVPRRALPAVIKAMINAHPYEEPAFDIYPLARRPVFGIGRVGKLPRPTPVAALARKLKRATTAPRVQIVGASDRLVDRAIVVAGAAGTLPFRMPLASNDVIITGELRHHEALTVDRIGCSAIVLGHWASERPVLAAVQSRLAAALPNIDVRVSARDADPLHVV